MRKLLHNDLYNGLIWHRHFKLLIAGMSILTINIASKWDIFESIEKDNQRKNVHKLPFIDLYNGFIWYRPFKLLIAGMSTREPSNKQYAHDERGEHKMGDSDQLNE